MTGNDQVRFCSQCNLNVFNLSAMTTEEAEGLIGRTEGRICARFYRRSDGTILTKNCPVGLQAVRERLTRIRISIIAAIVSFLGHLGLVGACGALDNRFAVQGALVSTTGELSCPISVPSPTLPIMSESLIRERAIFKVAPIYHSVGSVHPNGDVLVKVVIDEEGNVDKAKCETADPVVQLLAEGAAARWKFQPILVDGQPARVESVLTFNFAK